MLRFVVFGLLASFFVSDAQSLGKIVGGKETTIEVRPYQVSLQTKGFLNVYFHFCGGSIISSKYILTAAHCTEDLDSLANVFARAGSTDYSAGGQLISLKRTTSHPKYDGKKLEYDFALFEVLEDIVFGPLVKVIKLTDTTNPAEKSMVTVSGWGVTSESSFVIPENLREVDLPVFNHENCKKIYPNVTEAQICLGGTAEGGTSACLGDSGGPCVQNGVQYALVSGGISCTAKNIPGFYARISIGRDWIKQVSGV